MLLGIMKKLFFGDRLHIGINVGNFKISYEFGRLSIFKILKIIFLFVLTLISKPSVRSLNCCHNKYLPVFKDYL